MNLLNILKFFISTYTFLINNYYSLRFFFLIFTLFSHEIRLYFQIYKSIKNKWKNQRDYWSLVIDVSSCHVCPPTPPFCQFFKQKKFVKWIIEIINYLEMKKILVKHKLHIELLLAPQKLYLFIYFYHDGTIITLVYHD